MRADRGRLADFGGLDFGGHDTDFLHWQSVAANCAHNTEVALLHWAARLGFTIRDHFQGTLIIVNE